MTHISFTWKHFPTWISPWLSLHPSKVKKESQVSQESLEMSGLIAVAWLIAGGCFGGAIDGTSRICAPLYFPKHAQLWNTHVLQPITAAVNLCVFLRRYINLAQPLLNVSEEGENLFFLFLRVQIKTFFVDG